MGRLFFTSDEHYGHANIIKFCNRPFMSVYDMNEVLIANHNAVVGEADFTWHLGDMFWHTVTVHDANAIFDRLNGKHGIVWGNHDEVARQIAGRFDYVGDTKLVKSTRVPVWLSHYAHRSWPNSHKGSYHLFGHTHAVLPDFRYSHDAGVDTNDYQPFSFEELDTYMLETLLPRTAPEVRIDMVKKGVLNERQAC